MLTCLVPFLFPASSYYVTCSVAVWACVCTRVHVYAHMHTAGAFLFSKEFSFVWLPPRGLGITQDRERRQEGEGKG